MITPGFACFKVSDILPESSHRGHANEWVWPCSIKLYSQKQAAGWIEPVGYKGPDLVVCSHFTEKFPSSL